MKPEQESLNNYGIQQKWPWCSYLLLVLCLLSSRSAYLQKNTAGFRAGLEEKINKSEVFDKGLTGFALFDPVERN